MERVTRKHFRPGNSIKLIKEAVLLKMYDKLAEYEDAEEQGLLLRLPCKLGDIIDRIISHNEIVTLMFETEISSFRGLQHFLAWNSMEYPERIFGITICKNSWSCSR